MYTNLGTLLLPLTRVVLRSWDASSELELFCISRSLKTLFLFSLVNLELGEDCMVFRLKKCLINLSSDAEKAWDPALLVNY